jgi:hypothetical protein
LGVARRLLDPLGFVGAILSWPLSRRVVQLDGLDNGGIPSAERILSEFQEIAAGDVMPTGIFTYVLEPLDESSTRLIMRRHSAPRNAAAALVMRLLVRPVSLAMQRRQFLNIKRRVETPTALPRS